MNRKLAFSLLLGAFTLASWAQQAMTVKGTVKDSDNNPVIGAISQGKYCRHRW